jgi:HK97 family phage portal protein
MLHVRGLSFDGIIGLSPIEVHRQQLGLMMAMQEHAGRLYGNGMTLKGIIKHPGHLSDKGAVSLKERMEHYRGTANSHKTLILEEAMQYEELGMKLEDAQFIESMGYNDTDVAGIFQVPPHKIGILDKGAAFASIVQQEQSYINSTLDPTSKNWAGEIHCSLLSARERDSVFVQPDYSHLLEGDWEGLANLLTAEGNLGSISPDEVREKFRRNPLPGGVGKMPRAPLNTAPLGTPVATNPEVAGNPAQRLNGAAVH